MNAQERKARDRIVEAAMELFGAKGYNSTSVADILSRTQLNSGSLYHAFPGKQDILIAVLERYRDGLYPMLIDPAWREEPDPIERIFALLARYRWMILETECSYGCPIGSLALEIHEPDPEVRELLAANFVNWTDAVTRCLEQMGNRLPPDTDRRALAELILTVMEGAIMQARTFHDIGVFDRNVAMLAAHLDALERVARGATATGA